MNDQKLYPKAVAARFIDATTFQNFARRDWFRHSGIQRPDTRGAWRFSRDSLLEIAIMKAVSAIPGKQIRRQVVKKLYDTRHDRKGLAVFSIYDGIVAWLPDSANLKDAVCLVPQAAAWGPNRPTVPTSVMVVDMDGVRNQVESAISWWDSAN